MGNRRAQQPKWLLWTKKNFGKRSEGTRPSTLSSMNGVECVSKGAGVMHIQTLCVPEQIDVERLGMRSKAEHWNEG